MLRMLTDKIRRAGKLFSGERRRESEREKLPRRGTSRGYRAARYAVCKLFMIAVMLNAFPVHAQTTASGDTVMAMTYFRPASGTCAAESGTVTAIRQPSSSTGGTAMNQFDGVYTGSWSLTCPLCGDSAAAGTFTTTLASGVFTETRFIRTSGTHNISPEISGTVDSSGAITGTARAPDGCSNSVGKFSGQITAASGGSGQTTAIVASGLWNMVTSISGCTNTGQEIINLAYTNGAYSGTHYDKTNIDPTDCVSREPRICAATDFYRSGKDLLSASQFREMLTSFMTSCWDSSGIGLSLSFLSPDSVLGTGFDSGRGFSFRMTRVASTPSSYALAVAKAGTGSGTVTSTPEGIDCGVSCRASFSSGAAVSLTATPSPGSYFAGWRGVCTGRGSCSVTMDAARKIIAIFKLKPFAAAASSLITATKATITASITFDTPNLGKHGAVFITSWAPARGLGAMGVLTAPTNKAMSVTTTRDNPYTGGEVNTRQEALAAVLAAADPNAFVLVQLTSSGWQLVQDGQLIPYTTGVMGDALSSLSILNNTDPSNLLGAQFCVGYGTSAAEMIAAGRMMPVADIPGATATATGSCDVTDIAVEFYNTNLDHYFITADASEAAQIDSGSAGPGWSRTGNSFRSGGDTSVCRFYGSQSPGPNSHFYTVDASECAGLQLLQASTPDTEKRWNFESMDFVSTPASSGACPAGATPVYRAYNNGFARGVDSNHRITGSLSAIQEVVTRGWSDEGVVMCAPN